jgi:hypothetical protein
LKILADEILKVVGKQFPCQQRGLGLTWKLRFDDLIIVVGGKQCPRKLKWFSNCGGGSTETQEHLNEILCEPIGGKYMCEGLHCVGEYSGFLRNECGRY